VLALVASLFLVAYLVVPGVLFRALFSLYVPLRAFDRTRTQEFAYSAVVCVAPYVLAVVLVWYTDLGRWPFPFQDTWAQRDADYKTVVTASFAEPFADSKDQFWTAATRSGKRQLRVLSWYIVFVGAEALLLGFVASNWGTWQLRLAGMPRTERFLTRLLLANVSEWHVLLTNFLFPGTTIQVDVLTAEDRLYRGQVLSYTRDREGVLTGIYLDGAERYDRAGLLADRASGVAKGNPEYWKSIPGKRLYIFADKLFTLNIRPQTTLGGAQEIVALELGPEFTVSVTAVPVPSTTAPKPTGEPFGKDESSG
jgi:hypothetical protein